MDNALIECRDVAKTFVQNGGNVTALANITLHVGRYEFVSVLGPSGCGKSTLLRLIAGLTTSSAGLITVANDPVIEPRDDIGIVFQKPTLLPWLSVLANVTFPMKHKNGRVAKADRDRAMSLIDMMGLCDFADASIDQLSGGMQQRVAIARALLLDPDILLMDEPFSALDALTREQMSFELLDLIEERPKTVVFITHSIAEAVLLSDRVVILSDRPSTVREVLAVDIPRPRTLDSMSDPRYNEVTNYIRGKLFARRAA